MKKRNLFFLIFLVGCIVVPTAFGVCDSLFPEGLQPEPGMDRPLYEIFVKFGDMVGETIEAQHKGWCESVAFEHGVVREKGTQEPQSLMQSTMNPFVITKFIDRATPKLNEAALKGKIFPLITVDLVRSGKDGYIFMQYLLKNAVVTSVSITGDAMHGQPNPMEKVQFSSEEITWKYMITRPLGGAAGTVEFNWKSEVEIKKFVDISMPASQPQAKQIDISGKWESSVAFVFTVKQQGNQFSWTIEGLNQPATGNINGNKLSATWKDSTGTKSAKGEIVEVDPKGRATKIKWDNNIDFWRD